MKSITFVILMVVILMAAIILAPTPTPDLKITVSVYDGGAGAKILPPLIAVPVSAPADTRAGPSQEAEVSSSLVNKNTRSILNNNTLANGGMGQKFLYRLNT